MPAFFVFIEFDGQNDAQKTFIVHVDNDLISRVLKRLHEIEQSDAVNRFNKRTMTIKYDDSDMMQSLDGNCLKETLQGHIGNSMAGYVANKKSHLESTGFEKGFSQIHFKTEGEENLKKLVDVSVGIGRQVSLAGFRGTYTRFGIVSKSPFVESKGGSLEMPNVEPNAQGSVIFKEDNLSAGMSFKAKLYISPFNAMVPERLRKVRIEGDFFDIKFNPFTGDATHSFSFGEGVRLEVVNFRNALKLLSLLTTAKKQLQARFLFENFPVVEFTVGCKDYEFNFSKELNALESAIKILSNYVITDCVDISFAEVSQYETEICQLEGLINSSHGQLRVDFRVDDEEFNPTQEVACIALIAAPIGSHIFGVFLVVTGQVETAEDGSYTVATENPIIEKKIVSEKDETIRKEDFTATIELIESKYSKNYTTVLINTE
jgi:hypothetical protein